MTAEKAPVESLRKGLAILEILSRFADVTGMPLSLISEKMGLRQNTTHNLLKTLCMCGYARNLGNGRYVLGTGPFELVKGSILVRDLHPLLSQTIERLSMELGEAVVLTVLQDDRRRVIGRATGQGAVQVNIRSVDNEDKPFWATVTGRVLAAHCTEGELAGLLETEGFPKSHWEGIADVDSLARALEAIRRRGFAEQVESGEVASVAVPVLDPAGLLTGALGLHFPAYRYTPSSQQKFIAGLRSGSARLAEALRVICRTSAAGHEGLDDYGMRNPKGIM